MVKILPILLLLALAGCRASTDLSQLGVGAGATWNDGPKVGVDVGAGKHEVEIAPLFPAAGDAAEGGAGESCPDGKCGVRPAPALPGARPGFCPN